MTEPILEVKIKPLEDKLRLSWGMAVENGKYAWKPGSLQVRLYAEPFDDLNFGKPELMNMQAATKETSSSISIPIANLLTFSGEKSNQAFRAGTVFSDPHGRCFPVHLDLSDETVPAGAVIAYPIIEWPADMSHSFTAWVQFGYEKNDRFEVVHRAGPFVHHPDADTEEDIKLPTVEIVPDEERAHRRGAAPRLFISYAHHNMGQVNEIATRLSNEFYYDVWIDYDSIPGGTRWREELAKGIQQADVVLFMATPEAIASRYCAAEIEYAKIYNRKIIPLRLNGILEASDLDTVAAGLSDLQYIDFVSDTPKTAWDKLLDALPSNLARDRKLLHDGKLKDLHQIYLRSMFARFEQIRSPYMPEKPLKLMDVYVPLKLGVSFNIEVSEGEMVDWWLRDVDEPVERREAMPDDMARQAAKPKSLRRFQPEGRGLDTWEATMQEVWQRYKQHHEEQQADKAESERQSLQDGTYYWNRIESETASALMPYVVITGDPGSGKSTILKHMTLCLAGDMLGRDDAHLEKFGFWPHPAYTPVFIELRSLVRSAFSSLTDEVTLDKFFNYIETKQLAPYQAEAYLEAIKEQLQDGDAIILLDGLDEVPDAADEKRRKQIKTLAHLLKATYPDCRIVVTSRPYAYAGDWSLDDFGEVRLSHLDSDRLEELALRLFRVELGQEGAEQEAEAFKEQMKRVPDELRSSPLFFTLMASIWLENSKQPEDKRLPVTRGAIYRECVNMLIDRWTRKDASGQSLIDLIGISESDLRQLLERLAYRIHRQTGSGDDAEFEGGEITNVVRYLKLGRIDVWELMDALAQRAGVIYEKAPNLFQFAHRSFQEHLSACYLAGDHEQIIQHMQDDTNLWRNVLVLLPDELTRDEQRTLVELLLPEDETSLPGDPQHPLWITRYYGLHWLTTLDLDIRERYKQMLLEGQRDDLVQMLAIGALSPKERAEMGRILSELDDPRPGVGLRDDGLPDIAWGELVPAGTYTIGDDPGAWSRLDEQKVTFNYSYRLSRYPVTYAQFQAFLESDKYLAGAWWHGLAADEDDKQVREQRYQYANHPRENVNWYQTVAFTRWLTARYREAGLLDDDHEIRLPTEQEWEAAARYPDGHKFPYGDEPNTAAMNVDDTGIGQTSAVGLFPSGKNPALELYDLSGNVWEWCLNEYSNPDSTDVGGTSRRVLRGGSFLD